MGESFLKELKITPALKESLMKFSKSHPHSSIEEAFLLVVLEHIADVHPVLYVPEKLIYQNQSVLSKHLDYLERSGMLYREAQVIVKKEEDSVNSETTKVFINPFNNAVFGNNCFLHAEDEIVNSVATCPENTERAGGVKAIRYFVSTDPKVIHSYIHATSVPTVKTMFICNRTKKLFATKEGAKEEALKGQIKELSMLEMGIQKRNSPQSEFLSFLEKAITEEGLANFIAAIQKDKDLLPLLERWGGADGQEPQQE